MRSLQADVLAAASALRVELELRLDDAGASAGGTPRTLVRLGDRDDVVGADLKAEAGAWQTVRVTVPVSDELRARLRTSPAGTVDLGVTPLDAALRFSLASIRVEAVTK